MTITLQPPPGTPQDVKVVNVESASVRVTWQSVEDADSYIVTFIQATGDHQLGLCSAPHTATVSVRGLSASIDVGQDVVWSNSGILRAYTTYIITVVAANSVLGRSENSEPYQHTSTQTSAVVAPSNVTITSQSSTVIFVQWSGLSCCRLVNGVIVAYRVRYTSLNNGITLSVDKTLAQARNWKKGAEISLSGLTPFTNYSIEVAAVNEEGDVGMYSYTITEQTQEVPGPVVITVIPSFFKITITWEEPVTANGVITDYEVSYRPTYSSQSPTSTRTGLETSFTTTGRYEPGSSYIFTVKAYTRVGAGETVTITVSMLTKPPAVEGVQVTPLSGISVNVSWNALFIPDFSIDIYTVVYNPGCVLESWKCPRSQDGERAAVFPGSAVFGVIIDLDAACKYQFQVIATVTVNGVPLEGERSAPQAM